jgi:calcyphosin
VFIPQ